MARTMRDRLTTAARQLEEAGHPDSAAAVTAVLAPGGWTLLREQDAPFTTNLPLTTRKSLRDALKAAAEQRNVTLTAVVTEGQRKILDGSWTPPEPGKVVRGSYTSDDPRVVLNVTVEESLRVELRERIPALSEELGYRVTEGGSALAYLRYRLGLSESGVPIIEHTEGTWTAQQCAAFRSVSRSQWLADVASGVESKSLGVTKDGVELWDAASVRGY